MIWKEKEEIKWKELKIRKWTEEDKDEMGNIVDLNYKL